MNLSSFNILTYARLTGILNLVIILFVLFCPIQRSMGQTFRYFQDTSCQKSSKPMLLHSGEKVIIGCDTAYLINSARYRLYEKAKYYLMTMTGNKESRTILEFENSLKSMDQYFQGLQATYFTLSDEVQKKEPENKAALERVDQDLAESKAALQKTRNELDDVVKDLNRTKRKHLRNNLLFGVGGLATGLLMGVLL